MDLYQIEAVIDQNTTLLCRCTSPLKERTFLSCKQLQSFSAKTSL